MKLLNKNYKESTYNIHNTTKKHNILFISKLDKNR